VAKPPRPRRGVGRSQNTRSTLTVGPTSTVCKSVVDRTLLAVAHTPPSHSLPEA
jgi:hypothetical protein